MKLYKLTEQYQNLENALATEVLTQEMINETLQFIQGQIEEKVTNTAKLVLSLNTDVEAIDKEIDRLSERKRQIQSNINWTKTYLMNEMIACNLLKIRDSIVNVSVANNPPSVEILDQSKLTEEFLKTIPEQKIPNKEAILKYFKETSTIPDGCDINISKKHLLIR